MRVDVTSAFGLIMTAALIALTSLFALSVFAARTSSTKRSPSIFAEPTGSAVFLFDGPALVDCDVNPNEPPLPGKIEYSQAKAFVQSFLRGQPHKAATVASIAKDKLNQVFR